MSYHNGSVWPHDNALIALGLARYGFLQESAKILGALLDISIFVPLGRLPELVCGFGRRADEGPTLYPVACSPQAWAAGSVFMGIASDSGFAGARLDARSPLRASAYATVPAARVRIFRADGSVMQGSICWFPEATMRKHARASPSRIEAAMSKS
jgi:hypothetical protein